MGVWNVTRGADADLRDVLRDLFRDPQAAVRFRQFLALFLTRYKGLEAGTLEFGANTKDINRITACLRSLSSKIGERQLSSGA